jgi:hypothetical protein
MQKKFESDRLHKHRDLEALKERQFTAQQEQRLKHARSVSAGPIKHLSSKFARRSGEASRFSIYARSVVAHLQRANVRVQPFLSNLDWNFAANIAGLGVRIDALAPGDGVLVAHCASIPPLLIQLPV